MAFLLSKQSNLKIRLAAIHTFGRLSNSNFTVLEHGAISRQHASIFWDGDQWWVKDFSSNGTYINGRRLRPNAAEKITPFDQINFANLESETWELICNDSPMSMLLPISEDLPVLELQGFVALPSDENMEMIIYQSKNGEWVCENQLNINKLFSGDIVGSHEKRWVFVDSKASDRTAEIKQTLIHAQTVTPSDMCYIFNVSQNEEHVSLTLEIGKKTYDLGERIHHYLLLMLARKRLADQKKETDESERGWMSKEHLSQLSGLNEEYMNIQIYRFRKQVTNALPNSFQLHQTIERRLGQLRFSFDNIYIEGGNKKNQPDPNLA